MHRNRKLALPPAGLLLARGRWTARSVIASSGTGLGQVFSPIALAVDSAGDLYITDHGGNSGRIRMWDAP
jgi:hypothetical protein